MVSSIGIIENIIIAILEIVVGVVFALLSITLSLNLLDRLNRELDIVMEIKEGNLATAVYVAGILIAVANVIGQAAAGISRAVLGGQQGLIDLVAGLVQLFIGIPLAVVAIFITQNTIYGFLVRKIQDRVKDFEAFTIASELKRRNISVAVTLFGSFFAISTVISQAISYLSVPIVQAFLGIL
jgi:uncharacterized membrane protein YjfL (UPF0719 family)